MVDYEVGGDLDEIPDCQEALAEQAAKRKEKAWSEMEKTLEDKGIPLESCTLYGFPETEPLPFAPLRRQLENHRKLIEAFQAEVDSGKKGFWPAVLEDLKSKEKTILEEMEQYPERVDEPYFLNDWKVTNPVKERKEPGYPVNKEFVRPTSCEEVEDVKEGDTYPVRRIGEFGKTVEIDPPEEVSAEIRFPSIQELKDREKSQ